MGADQNFFEIRIIGIYPKNAQTLKRSDQNYGVAIEKLTQRKRPRTSEQNHEANRKQIGKSAALICLDRSDRCAILV
jgi:hypothetical protein